MRRSQALVTYQLVSRVATAVKPYAEPLLKGLKHKNDKIQVVYIFEKYRFKPSWPWL